MTTKTRKTTRSTPAPVEAGPSATRHADGRVMALRPALYPECKDDVLLYCAACNELHPARIFALNGKRGSGMGRMTQCRATADKRWADSKALKAAGKPALPVPHIDAEHTVPKPAPKEAAAPATKKATPKATPTKA